MELGVYVNLPSELYHADPAIGSSGIKQLLRDPAEYWWKSPLNPNREESDQTPAMKFGSAYHQLILEPHKFSYKVKPNVKTTKEEGMLGEGEYAELQAMRAALMFNKKQFAILSSGVAEVSVFFDYEHQGKITRCKVRFDLFAPHWIADLKTSGDISDKGLRYAFSDFGYDISGSMYSVAAQELKKMIANGYQMPPEFDKQFVEEFISNETQCFAFVFQQKSAPYSSRVFVMSPWATGIGRDKYHHGLEIYQEHKEIEGHWPSKYSEIESIEEGQFYL